MEHYLIIARSVTYAQRMPDRAPRDLTDRGCAYAVEIAAGDLSAALPVLYGESLNPVQIFLTQRGTFREVAP